MTIPSLPMDQPLVAIGVGAIAAIAALLALRKARRAAFAMLLSAGALALLWWWRSGAV